MTAGAELRWIGELKSALSKKGACVLVTVARARGSTPRESGAKMIVSDEGIAGSIGGGNLEFAAIARARTLMKDAAPQSFAFEEFALGPSLGQCCGGSVTLCFEAISGPAPSWLDGLAEAIESGRRVAVVTQPMDGHAQKTLVTAGALLGGPLDERTERSALAALQSADPTCEYRKGAARAPYLLETFVDSDVRLVLFGAGHVGKALIRILGDLPFQVTWVDPRPPEYPDQFPQNVTPKPVADVLQEVDRAVTGSFFLVMSHSHQLDLAICERVLRRGDFSYLGLIGSTTKRERFRRQLFAAGLSQASIDRLVCPIGIQDIPGKHPGEIAIGVAAQLLQFRGTLLHEP